MITLLVPAAFAAAAVAAARGMWSPCGLSMLSSLNPVSESARGHRFWVTACWYVCGAAVGGAVLGGGCAVGALAFAAIGIDDGWTWALALAGAAVAVVSDSASTRPALPVHPRQVDERWLVKYRRWIYAGGFGAQIGTGFATYIMTAAVYLTALLAVLTGSPLAALLIGLAFGVLRGLAVVVTSRTRTPEGLRHLIARVDRLGEPCLQLARAVEVAVGTLAAWSLGGPLAAMITVVPLAALALPRRSRTPVIA